MLLLILDGDFNLKIILLCNQPPLSSVLLDRVTQSKRIIISINWRDRGYHLTFFQLFVFERHSPASLIAIVSQSAFNHIQSHPYDVFCSHLSPIIRTRGVAIVPSLSIVNSPAVHTIWEGFLKIRDSRSTYSNFDKLTFIDEYFEIVSTTLCESFCAHGGLESVAFGGLRL